MGVSRRNSANDFCETWMYQIICHDDVIKWKHFPRYWPFVRGIHRSPVNSPHKGQWRGALMFSLICARINGWVNNRETGDLRRHRTHHDVIVMMSQNGLGVTVLDKQSSHQITNVFFDLRLNKRLNKQSWGWWLETLSRPLWRHCNVEAYPWLFINARMDDG